MVYLERGNIPPNTVPSVLSTEGPKQLTILGIVYEKDGVFKKTFKSQKGNSPLNKKVVHQSFKTMADTLKKVRTKLKKIMKGYCKSKNHKRND